MEVKYKQYSCSYGAIIVYENEHIEFIPNKKYTGLNFDKSETCILVDEDTEYFKNNMAWAYFIGDLSKNK